MKFNDWILNELLERNWSQADLARHTKLTRSAISKYMGGRTPDDTALRKIAKAFNLPQEIVFRAAGSLQTPTVDNWSEKMYYKIGQLSGTRREMAERLLDTLLDEQERETRQTTVKPAKP
jgi:transcriptional regulator with XRE-family HTH domain